MSYLPDGKRFVYEDVKGFEDNWRKHHTSSVTRDIWLYDPATGKHVNLTARGGEDLNPVAAGDKFYFLSERDGKTINVYSAPIANPADARAVTSFKTHPVRFLSRAADGTLCFTYDGEIYTMTDGAKPAKVAIDIVDDIVEEPYKRSVSRAEEMEVSPDGKMIAFTSRGDVFVTSVDYKTTKQITSTPPPSVTSPGAATPRAFTTPPSATATPPYIKPRWAARTTSTSPTPLLLRKSP